MGAGVFGFILNETPAPLARVRSHEEITYRVHATVLVSLASAFVLDGPERAITKRRSQHARNEQDKTLAA